MSLSTRPSSPLPLLSPERRAGSAEEEDEEELESSAAGKARNLEKVRS